MKIATIGNAQQVKNHMAIKITEENAIRRLKKAGLNDEEIAVKIGGVRSLCEKTRNDFCDMLEMAVRIAEEQKHGHK